jgi:putative tryptophan/tyrosine transport system substrate-binding protein
MTVSNRTAAMPSRRAVLAAGAATLLACSAGRAQQPGRTYRIGFITLGARRNSVVDAFFDELRQHGFVEGANLLVDGKFEVDIDTLDAAATEVAQRAPDAIVCIGTVVVRAGQRATRTIPILAYAYDLIGSKLVSSLARPDSNTTGFSIVATELDSKRQEILMELVPGARHMAALADPNAPYQLQALLEAAGARGVELSVYWAAKPDEVVPAIEAAEKAGAKALNVLASPMLDTKRNAIFSGAARARLPAIYQWPDMAKDGGLVAYGPPLPATFRQLARQLAKLLNGAKPADIPVEQPTTFELAINLKTAKALGLTIPPSLLARADEVIE